MWHSNKPSIQSVASGCCLSTVQRFLLEKCNVSNDRNLQARLLQRNNSEQMLNPICHCHYIKSRYLVTCAKQFFATPLLQVVTLSCSLFLPGIRGKPFMTGLNFDGKKVGNDDDDDDDDDFF